MVSKQCNDMKKNTTFTQLFWGGSQEECKGRFFEDSAAEIFVQQYVHNTTTNIMKTLFF